MKAPAPYYCILFLWVVFTRIIASEVLPEVQEIRRGALVMYSKLKLPVQYSIIKIISIYTHNHTDITAGIHNSGLLFG